MDVLFHHIAQKSCGHAQKENGEAEGPLCCPFAEADVICDLLTEDGPAVDRTDAAVQQQRRNCGANPFVLRFHVVFRLLF